MFSQLQSQRPQIQPNNRPNPLHQQQTRNLQVEPHTEQSSVPRNQIEAMPPAKTMPEPLRVAAQPIQPMFNPAVMHPVFMGNFRKAPFPQPVNGSFSPVATGYVFARDRMSGSTKL